MIKLIVCDLDGTLLNKYQQLSKKSVEVMHGLNNHGIEFMMATGRDYNMVIEYLEENNLKCDLILNNGAQYMSSDHQDNRYFPMDEATTREVVKILLDHNFHLSMHTTKGKYYFESTEDYFNHHYERIKVMFGDEDPSLYNAAFYRKDGYLRNSKHIDSLDELFQDGAQLLKIDADCDNEKSGLAALEALKKTNKILLSTSYAQYIEVCSNQSHKGGLLQTICKEKGYQYDEVCVFGDSTNDIQMLELFENSFVPCNGHELAKQVGKYIIGNNNEDGVAIAIEKIIKEKNGIDL